MKICGKCKSPKKEQNFSKSHFKKSGGWCRECNTNYMREFKSKNLEKMKQYQSNYDAVYYQENKDKILQDKKEYYQENKEEIIEDRKEYYQENKEEKQKYNKLYYQDNKETLICNAKKYYIQNKNSVRIYSNFYNKNKRLTNPNFKIRTTVSANINFHLKSNGSSKNGNSCLNYLQYTISILKEHLENLFEPWMTWENYGRYKSKTWNDNDQSTWTWQIDHIIPQSTFKYTSMEDEEFKKCWALENLRPYSAQQNFLDGVTRIRH